MFILPPKRPFRHPTLSDEPILAELFSIERLEQHAETLANSHLVVRRASGGRALLHGVKRNANLLRKGFQSVADSIRDKQAITPAAEWLADNFHIVEEQIREIIDDLPPGFYRTLPKLADGPLAGYPRVYGITFEFVAHTDSRLDPEWLKRFIMAYQSVHPLDIGEGWALPIALRILLVENLRRVTDRIRASMLARRDADKVADAFIRIKDSEPAKTSALFERFENTPLSQSFAVQLVQRLRDQGSQVSEALQWLDARLSAQHVSAEELVRREHQEQTTMNGTVRNIITSMRLLSSLDWSEFFEAISVVDRILRDGSAFGSMDFATRDLYRHAVEELSRGSKLSEIEVTRRVLGTAREASTNERLSAIERARQTDPGYYLVSTGRRDFERSLRFRVPFKQRLLRMYIASATPAYLGSIALITFSTLALLAYWTDRLDPHSPWLWAFLALSVIPASDLAMALVNRWITTSLGPRYLPKLDYDAGIPVASRTLVVIPTLLTSEKSIEEDLERLSIHYLSNADGYLQFALLTDWTDASTERAATDDALLKSALDGIANLNRRYGKGPDDHPRFFLFHRNRMWNAQEKKWMGWERKRGKLHELNRLLRGDKTTSFLPTLPVPERAQEIRYVLTLDADSRLSRGSAYRLAASMAHPLNQPRYDPMRGRVVEGYGIIQPRITPTLPTPEISSLFQWIFSGSAGIDPYAFAVSDVYQDLFKEGSYVGKGIYDIDAFEQALQGKVPPNRMLSHDLFEGLYAGAALVTEIEVFEEFPSHYEVDVARHHRWVRGDWQLLPWILRGSRLPLIARWKMIDNLRRSLSTPSLFLGLWATWLSPADAAPLWTVFLLTTVVLPPMLSVIAGIWPHRTNVSLRSHLRGLFGDLKTAGWHILLALAFLPHQAFIMADAIVRTLYRLIVSRRRLLEWTSAAQAKDIYDYKLGAFYRRMASAPLLALTCVASVVWIGTPFRAELGGVFGALWFLSPWLAQRISIPSVRARIRSLSVGETRMFRLVARRTWRFFETFITVATHHLPPDNFQEIPAPIVAPRTSPTNIGLALLSIVSAHDFGWLGLSDMVERLENTLGTVDKLPKHQGHLFNWYGTHDLRPLDPLYVSTVDSGNLAGHLWTVASACREFSAKSLLTPQLVSGFEDVLALLRSIIDRLDEAHRTGTVTAPELREILGALEERVQRQKGGPASLDWTDFLTETHEHAGTLADMARALAQGDPDDAKLDISRWAESLLSQSASQLKDAAVMAESNTVPAPLRRRLLGLAELCTRLANAMEFGFLFDPSKKIFSIGYQVGERKLDASYYDLLASEARLASYLAIAKGDVPTQHWFRLGRPLKPMDQGLALLSWSGSMFEYLMPSLVMNSPQRSLLDQTNRRVVQRQIAYGEERGVPWGVSESAYNAQNLEYTYQYSNFGVPGLGLKRGLGEDLVIAPYATALATMVDAPAAAENFVKLAAMGALGSYGYYEALDFTSTRLPEDQKVAIVRTYMAHHQGMSLVALTNVLHGDVVRARFHADPRVQASELLLQEKTPRNVPVTHNRAEEVEGEVRHLPPPVLRRFHSAHQTVPPTHLLSNGYYSVMITAAGSGYSRAGKMAVTRWREDTTRDNWGTFIFLRDVHSERVWSAGYQPIGAEPDRYEVDFSEDRAEIIRHDGHIITTLEVVVSPEDNAEIRRVSLKNTGGLVREIDVTSYAEVVLATPAADQAHPAFSNLFVQTEFAPEANGLLCTRRRRSPDDPPVWMAHVVVTEGDIVGPLQYETDRSKFLGRGRGVRTPMCVIDGKPLTNTVGAVIDPIMSLRKRVRIEPGATVHIAFTTMIAATRDDVLRLADKYHDSAMFERTVTLAWTQAHVQQNYLGIEPSEAHLFQNLASRLLYSHNGLRPSSDILKRNTRGAPGLWSFGISGDIPIVLVRIDETDDMNIVREILRAHEYWRMKNLAVDLVVLNERTVSYAQDLQVALENLVRTTQAGLRHDAHGAHGNIFLLRLDQLSTEDHILIRSAARVTLLSRQGTLAQQMERLDNVDEGTPPPVFNRPVFSGPASTAPVPKKQLEFFNGLGGFSEDGKEYVTVLGPGQWTPAPWANVISNPSFGFHVSESGSGSTWSVNSRENQLTPWSNDPVSDAPGEVFYLRDEDTGHVWTPTVLPVREEDSPYTIRHGQGYSQFEHASRGIHSQLLQCVPVNDSIKLSKLTLSNRSTQTRRIAVSAYVEWVLGTSRAASAPFLITEYEATAGAILATNPWNAEFGQRVAFAAWTDGNNSWTADRAEFLGRNGTLDHPYAIEHGMVLSHRAGAGLDPCAALTKIVTLRPGQQIELVFCLGQEADRASALSLLKKYQLNNLNQTLTQVRRQWEDALEAVQVKTPDRSLDIMVNHWLLYQTLACRIWSRAGFYQAGGAYGFRDQLQDVMALIVSRRDLAREHILRAAQRQFEEGDVQHWWHPPTGRGVRTKISDDLVWLPYVVSYYLEVTADSGILDEVLPFLEGKPIPEGREDYYYEPAVSKQTATLFEHCARALDHSLRVGQHGLPLMGTGDWNDGMNRIGHEGKGESVWLAWFLHTTLWEFAKVAQARGEHERAEKWRLHVGDLKTAVERQAWDGEWYARAFFDDGKVVGVSSNLECRIDAIAQSWGVLSGVADPARAKRAMEAVRQNLIRKDDGLVLIFTPPFNHSNPSPGYIQGYVPGVRENGGQYTHAAIWTMLAFAALGDGNTAGDLFSLINPINHGKSRTDIHRYKVEPYVMAGDVYATPAHLGRGGWTWYTGSAGWMYRGALEWLLGFRLRGDALYFDPCIPEKWDGFEIAFRYHATHYRIKVENPQHVSRGVQSTEMDGKPIRGAAAILLTDDKREHSIRVLLG
jgi:cyclic beta-1,2-glucan synthetase